jgi:hypothetical protein
VSWRRKRASEKLFRKQGKGKGEGEAVSAHSVKAYEESRSIAPLIIHLCVKRK